MTTQIYQFRVRLEGYGTKIWRKLEISSNSSVAELAYTILASFDAGGYHLYSIDFKGKVYDCMIETNDFWGSENTGVEKVKLKDLDLKEKDKMKMTYDFGASWTFYIEFQKSREEEGDGKKYPIILAGKGQGIIEDISPYELAEIIEKTDKTGDVEIDIWDDVFDWDYREYDIESDNECLKECIQDIKNFYENKQLFDEN